MLASIPKINHNFFSFPFFGEYKACFFLLERIILRGRYVHVATFLRVEVDREYREW